MRVLQSVRYRWLAQTETWLYNQVRFLPKAVECHVVTQTVQNRDQFEVPHLHALENAPWPRRALDAAMMRVRARRYPGFLVERGRAIRPDVMHAHFGPWGWSVRHAARRIDVPLVVTFYGFDVHQLPKAQPCFRQRYDDLFRDAAAVLCEGEHMRAGVIDLGCPPETVHVHRLGIDLDQTVFRPREIKSGQRLRVLMASAFREKKGIPIGIEALGRVARDVDLELTIVGDASELAASRTEKQRIEMAVLRSGLSGRVHWRGFLKHNELQREVDQHDLFLCPSHEASDGDTEGGAPVVLIEMAAAGIPVVSTEHCDIPGVVRNGETGLLAREGNVESLEAAIRRAIDIGPRWRSMTEAAREHIEERFDARRQGEALAEHYRRAAAAHASARARINDAAQRVDSSRASSST